MARKKRDFEVAAIEIDLNLKKELEKCEGKNFTERIKNYSMNNKVIDIFELYNKLKEFKKITIVSQYCNNTFNNFELYLNIDFNTIEIKNDSDIINLLNIKQIKIMGNGIRVYTQDIMFTIYGKKGE